MLDVQNILPVKVVPHLILRSGNNILLTRRAKTQKLWANHWHCVTGSVEAGETPKQTIIRETYEEISITLSNVRLVTVVSLTAKDYFDPNKDYYALELFFLANLPDDQNPINAEPLKQDAMAWFLPTALPSPMIPSVKFGLENFLQNNNYAEYREY